jgi:hypothetical protein
VRGVDERGEYVASSHVLRDGNVCECRWYFAPSVRRGPIEPPRRGTRFRQRLRPVPQRADGADGANWVVHLRAQPAAVGSARRAAGAAPLTCVRSRSLCVRSRSLPFAPVRSAFAQNSSPFRQFFAPLRHEDVGWYPRAPIRTSVTYGSNGPRALVQGVRAFGAAGGSRTRVRGLEEATLPVSSPLCASYC